jgi:exosortase
LWAPLFAGIALLLCYLPIVSGLLVQWRDDEDMNHGFLVPLFIAWVVWRERERWLRLSPKPSLRGWLLLAIGAAGHLASVGGAGLFAGVLALLISSVGAVIAIGGFAYLRVWIFPVALTLFMLPRLAVVYNQITLPLQLAATKIAATMLRAGGSRVLVDGNIIQIANQQIAVEEACNGLRYLLSLGFLAVVLAYLYGRTWWMRWALLLASIPVAILANALRIASTGWLALLDPKYADGTLHTLSGTLLFALCLPVLFFITWTLNRVHIRRHEI